MAGPVLKVRDNAAQTGASDARFPGLLLPAHPATYKVGWPGPFIIDERRPEILKKEVMPPAPLCLRPALPRPRAQLRHVGMAGTLLNR